MPACTVTSGSAGQRLDLFLHGRWPEHSRAFLQKLIDDGRVLVNGRAAKRSYRVRTGDAVSIEIPPPRPLEARPEEIPLEILHEDDDLIVVNKPVGMVVHPAAGNDRGTLVNALLQHCRGKLAGIGGVERPGIVHRLDKGTSGCIVVAKTDRAHQSLVAQFKARQVRKVYLAVCWGQFPRLQGTIETTIGRSEHHRQKMSAGARRGRAARSDYRVLRQLAECAFVEVQPQTGRTHQIRVHLAHVGHPIVGDVVYGRACAVPTGSLRRAGLISVARPLLHAYKLGFTHPGTGLWIECVAPVPDDIAKLAGAVGNE